MATPQRALSLSDVISLMVGTVIAAGIYEATPTIAQSGPSASWLMGVWVFGGLITLAGALCYAELATAMPEDGGDYVYLSKAYGRSAGFLFAWAEVLIVRPGSVGLVALVCARYANELWPLDASDNPTWLARNALVIYAVVAIAGYFPAPALATRLVDSIAYWLAWGIGIRAGARRLGRCCGRRRSPSAS